MEYFSVSPNEIVINFENNRLSPSIITLTNVYFARVAFKIKATNPNQFTVKPNRGFIDPKSQVQIEIQAHADENSEINSFANQKFLILGKDAGQARSLLDLDELWKNIKIDSSIQQKKISTEVFKIQNGSRQQLTNPKLIQSVYTAANELRGSSQSSFASQIKTTNGNGTQSKSYEDAIDKQQQLEEQMMTLRMKREQLFNEVAESQIKKPSGSKLFSLLIPILLGVLISLAYTNQQQILPYF